MTEDDEPKPEEMTGCYQWECRYCHAGGVFQTESLAQQEADSHDRENGDPHHSQVWQCD